MEASKMMVESRGLFVRYRYQDPPILSNIAMAVSAGESIAIMGPSGCGKSTLLCHLAGLRRPESGEILLNQQSLVNLSAQQMDQLRSDLLGFVFQRACLLPYLNVAENILLALESADSSDEEKRAVVSAVLERVGLANLAERRASELSVGEAQRVSVGRALVKSPAILFADEPTASLDGENVSVIADLICEGSGNTQGRTVIVATHDERVAERCQRVFHLQEGKLSTA